MQQLKFLTVMTLMVIVVTISSSSALKLCPAENCIPPNHCEIPSKYADIMCSKKGTACCSVVKSEFRTHCRHHGGVCQEKCSFSLQREVVDCPSQFLCGGFIFNLLIS